MKKVISDMVVVPTFGAWSESRWGLEDGSQGRGGVEAEGGN
jgi:hypothetical protein